MILGNPGVVNLGVNWRSPKIGISYSTPFFATGESDLFTDTTNNPGFVDAAGRDYRIIKGSTAEGKTGPLAIAVTSNSLGLDLTPRQQFVPGLLPLERTSLTDAGAYQYVDTWVSRRR
jgi:hypothetical protein